MLYPISAENAVNDRHHDIAWLVDRTAASAKIRIQQREKEKMCVRRKFGQFVVSYN
jgi:hypothetical protein